MVDLCPPNALEMEAAKDWGLAPLPGRALIRMVKPADRGGILLPDRVTHICDVGRVEAGSLPLAQTVVVRPYAGLWLNLAGSLDGRLLGVNDPLWHSIPAVWDGSELAPLGPWFTARLEDGWWRPLALGPDCPSWLGGIERVRAEAFRDALAVSPGFGQDGVWLVCTRA